MVANPLPHWTCPESRCRASLLEGREELVCTADESHRVPIVEGIPRFVPTERYSANFGAQWHRHPRTQLDSFTGFPITRNRTRQALGEAIWSRLEGTRLLECGCGAGRFTEILLDRGALVTSIDLSSAVEVNEENFPLSKRHRIAQADILQLPFPQQSFDGVFCLGVTQHTPDPEATMAALYGMARPGGWMVIDHYTWHIGRATSVKPIVRQVLKRMDPRRAQKAVDHMVEALLPLHQRLRDQRILWSLLCRVSPLTTFYRTYPELPDELQKEWARLDTHDSLTDWFKHMRSARQIEAALDALGAVDIDISAGGNGIEARCRRPLAPS